VLPVVIHRWAYVTAILIGTAITALAINAWKSYGRPKAVGEGV
jgi:fructose-specific phosphotransferase system IIC component